jgi:hypothetical protein
MVADGPLNPIHVVVPVVGVEEASVGFTTADPTTHEHTVDQAVVEQP